MISEEVIRVDIDRLDDATQAQRDDRPVVSGSSSAACFPSIHPFAAIGVLISDENSATGLQQIFFLGEKFIIREQGFSANALGREVDQTWRCSDSGFGLVHFLK